MKSSYQDYRKGYELLFQKKTEFEIILKVIHEQEKSLDDGDIQMVENQVLLLKFANAKLEEMRTERSQEILENLERLMLKQLNDLGLTHYKKVSINPVKFTITYSKFGENYTFDKITEGEKLRAKLALYLSLIQLDIQYSIGRHPRFIILDTPAKEEADKRFLEGIKEALLAIDKNFGSQVQIFVGTAERRFETIHDQLQTGKMIIKKEGIYIF